jgi:hypothetical protein
MLDEVSVSAKLCRAISAMEYSRNPIYGYPSNHRIVFAGFGGSLNSGVIGRSRSDDARLILRKSHPAAGFGLAQDFCSRFRTHALHLDLPYLITLLDGVVGQFDAT